MINKLLQIVAPHYCYGCGKVGVLLCQNCKYDIIEEPFSGCIVCTRPSSAGVCTDCASSYERAWCVAERTDVVERLINAYKFERVRDASLVFAYLLNDTVPDLPANVVVTNVPTVPSHIRRRGYDHAGKVARDFAGLRKLEYKTILTRSGSAEQRGQNKRTRFEQAKLAFICEQKLSPDYIYLLIDDITTTNASVRYAAQALRDAGAESVWVAVIARQPLDKQNTP